MKLVDIDGFELMRYEPQNDLAYALGWNDCADAIENELSNEPEIDAIPIDWLREKMRGYASTPKSTEIDAVVRVMQMWEREQEA